MSSGAIAPLCVALRADVQPGVTTPGPQQWIGCTRAQDLIAVSAYVNYGRIREASVPGLTDLGQISVKVGLKVLDLSLGHQENGLVRWTESAVQQGKPRGRSKVRLLVGLTFLIMLSPVPVLASNEAFLKETRRAIGSYFKNKGLMPVVLSAELSPGDVLSWDTWLVDEAAEFCFPDLKTDGPAPIALPDLSFKGTLEASFLVELGEFFGLQGEAERQFTVFIRYTDAKSTETTRGELQRSLSDDCAGLVPVVKEAPWSPEVDGLPPLIVGKAVTAKQSVFVVTSDERSAEIKAELSKLPIPASRTIKVADPKIAASFGSTADSGLVVETELELPVAIAPAFLFGIFPDRRGVDDPPGHSGDPVFAAREFDPDDTRHLNLFELTLEGVLDGPLELSK